MGSHEGNTAKPWLVSVIFFFFLRGMTSRDGIKIALKKQNQSKGRAPPSPYEEVARSR